MAKLRCCKRVHRHFPVVLLCGGGNRAQRVCPWLRRNEVHLALPPRSSAWQGEHP